MEKVFVDTSGWVALFVQNDRNHRKAASVFEDLKRGRAMLYTSDYIVDETVTVILMRGDHRESVVAGEALLTSQLIKIVPVYPSHFKAAWEAYKKYKDKKFSFTDVTSFSIMKDAGIHKAFSFDSDFTQSGFEVLN